MSEKKMIYSVLLAFFLLIMTFGGTDQDTNKTSTATAQSEEYGSAAEKSKGSIQKTSDVRSAEGQSLNGQADASGNNKLK